jgi:ubiquinone/menaquinone biosynthesis C-methylase UbiE
MWLLPLFLLIVFVAMALLVFVIATEGRYFGKRFLRRLYSLRAGTFETRDDWDQWLHLIRRLGISSSEHLLDLGTQTGHLPRLVARQAGFQGSAVGVDWSEEMIREAQRQSKLEGTSEILQFLCSDVRKPLPFPDDSFTLVVCVTGLLDGLRDPEPLFKEIRRVLRPKGRFAYSYTQRTQKPTNPAPLHLSHLLVKSGFNTPKSIPWLATHHVMLSHLEEK